MPAATLPQRLASADFMPCSAVRQVGTSLSAPVVSDWFQGCSHKPYLPTLLHPSAVSPPHLHGGVDRQVLPRLNVATYALLCAQRMRCSPCWILEPLRLARPLIKCQLTADLLELHVTPLRHHALCQRVLSSQ